MGVTDKPQFAAGANVALWHEADMPVASVDVRLLG
jgi:hypothetical protein